MAPASPSRAVLLAALRDGVRYSIVLLCGSLFVLAAPIGEPVLPEAIWILITVGIVGGFSNAAGSGLKAFERILGTSIGSGFALAFGFVSVTIESDAGRAAFIGSCIFFVPLGLKMFSCYYPKLSKRYPYAYFLGVLTFCFILLSFYSLDEPVWLDGIARTANIAIGIVIAFLGYFIIWPTPQLTTIQNNLAKVCGSTEKMISKVLDSFCDAESKPADPIALIIVEGTEDEFYSTYIETLTLLRGTKDQIPTIRIDPFTVCIKQHLENELLILTTIRLNRILMAVSLLDSIQRNEFGLHLSPTTISLLQEIRERLRRSMEQTKAFLQRGCLLTCSDEEKMERMALVTLTEQFVQECSGLSRPVLPECENMRNRPSDKRIPAITQNGVLFTSLVKHLVVRVLRLQASLDMAEEELEKEVDQSMPVKREVELPPRYESEEDPQDVGVV